MHASKRGGALMQCLPLPFVFYNKCNHTHTHTHTHETPEAIFVSFEEFAFLSDVIVKNQSCFPLFFSYYPPSLFLAAASIRNAFS